MTAIGRDTTASAGGETSKLSPGLCSVTFRQLDTDAIIARAVDGGLAGVEWGQDVHAPIDDVDRAKRLGEQTRRNGLSVTSLGSYYRAGATCDLEADREEWDRVVATARALQAPRVRVWAGRTGSAETPQRDRDRIVDGLRRCVDSAPDLVIATEFHSHTLTDDAASAVALLDDVPGLMTYWQPPNGVDVDDAIRGLEMVANRVAAAHVFSWWPDEHTRRPLAFRADLWERAVAALVAQPRPIDALLEFVPDDDPELLPREAATLRTYLAER